MTIREIIIRLQRRYGLEQDGIAGPITWRAIFNDVFDTDVPVEGAPVDDRSEKNIVTLHPHVQPFARALIRRAAQQGIEIKVISAMRTFEEQDELYEQGRTRPGKVVTNARGGYSNHNFGIAFDVGVFELDRYIPESPVYKAVGALGQTLGLEWGGSWRSFSDEPHFQLRPSWASQMTEKDMLATLRKRRIEGTDYFT